MTTTTDCPRCYGSIPNDKTPGAYPGAISRKDNKTEICSACGAKEALETILGIETCNHCWEPITKTNRRIGDSDDMDSQCYDCYDPTPMYPEI